MNISKQIFFLVLTNLCWMQFAHSFPGAYAFKNVGKFIVLPNGKLFEHAYNAKRKKLDAAVNSNVAQQCQKNPNSHLVGIIDRILELIAMRLVLIESREVDYPDYSKVIINKKAFESLLEANKTFSYCLAGIILNSKQFLKSHRPADIQFALVHLLSNPYEDRYIINGIVGKPHEPEFDNEYQAYAQLIQSITQSTEVKQATIDSLFQFVGEHACEKNLAELRKHMHESNVTA